MAYQLNPLNAQTVGNLTKPRRTASSATWIFQREAATQRGEPILFYKEAGELKAARLICNAEDETMGLYEALAGTAVAGARRRHVAGQPRRHCQARRHRDQSDLRGDELDPRSAGGGDPATRLHPI